MIRSDTYHSAPSSLFRRAAFYPAHSADEEHQLAVDGRAGSSSASERIILCNLRLASTIARDYTGLGLTLDDLVSEGSIGLMKAVSKFDPFHHVRFATYASFWVRHTILRALYNQNRVIRLPAHVIARLLKVKQVLERMTGELGREPNREELAAKIGIRLGLTSERVCQLHNQGLAKLRRKLKGDGRTMTVFADYLG
jgi:RNA polymerase primary sigma factor